MDDAIIAAMEKELAALDAKAGALRAVVLLYRGASHASARVKAPSTLRVGSTLRTTNDSTTATAVINAARLLCDLSVGPVPTKAILDQLIQDGVEIVGRVPQNVVSSILSRSPDFQSNGRSGWTSAHPYVEPDGSNENEAPNGNADGASEARADANPFQSINL